MDNPIESTPLVTFAEDNTEGVNTEEHIVICGSQPKYGIGMSDELIAKVNLLPVSAKAWVDLQLGMLQEAGCSLEGLNSFIVDFLDDPQNAEYRSLLEFLLPIVDISKIDENFRDVPLELTKQQLNGILKVDSGYLSMVMRAFPNIWGPHHAGEDVEKLLKASQAARMLQISESQVRQLAHSGELEYTRSQGETGHYRFKLQWLLNYRNKCDGGSAEKSGEV